MYLRLFIILLLVQCFSVTFLAQAPETEQKGYLLGPGDEITTKVLGDEQFDFVATIDEDGRMEVPFFEKAIDVKCKSERELRTELTNLLKKYLRNPQVNVRVTKRNSRPPVSIYGEVRQQQQIDLSRRQYLLELISFAGGETEKAGGMVQVFRTRTPICADPASVEQWGSDGNGVPSRMFSLASIRQGNQDANPEIFPGDIIVVQKSAPVYVIGEVIRPGEFNIPEGGLPLTQAIAMASGITREAKTKNVKILRRKTGSSESDVIEANYDLIRKGEQADIVLQPFDQVQVGKAPKSFLDYVIEFATGVPNRIPIPIRP